MLGVLVLTAWIVAGMVQSDARALAAEAARIPEDRVEMFDGLNVRLVGFDDEASRDAAVAAVDGLDSSWEVVGTIGGGNAADDGSGSAGTAAATTPTPPSTLGTEAGSAGTSAVAVAEAAVVSLDIAPDGQVVVRGSVADESRRIVIIDEIVARAGPENVTDELVVDPDAVTPAGGVLTATGAAGGAGQREVWSDGAFAVAQAAGLGFVDQLTVAAPADAQDTTSVEDELNALFELEPIEFDYNTATIRPASTATLDTAAATINVSLDDGVLLVVGHTDSDGPPADNLRLSQARADAVVTYLVDTGGVDPLRLRAEGRGETQLKVDPERSSNDKQRNRRIEWERVE
jgi:outer membrane protein OmpA-like peptidoglycan-associated protein